jgi:hypothetical protein
VTSEGTQELVAQVQAIVFFHRATATLSWHVAAPECFSNYSTLVVSKRAFETEGDAMDALLRVEALAMAGELPAELRDVI